MGASSSSVGAELPAVNTKRAAHIPQVSLCIRKEVLMLRQCISLYEFGFENTYLLLVPLCLIRTRRQLAQKVVKVLRQRDILTQIQKRRDRQGSRWC